MGAGSFLIMSAYTKGGHSQAADFIVMNGPCAMKGHFIELHIGLANARSRGRNALGDIWSRMVWEAAFYSRGHRLITRFCHAPKYDK